MKQDVSSLFTLFISFCLYSLCTVPSTIMFYQGHINSDTIYMLDGIFTVLQLMGIAWCLGTRLAIDMRAVEYAKKFDAAPSEDSSSQSLFIADSVYSGEE